MRKEAMIEMKGKQVQKVSRLVNKRRRMTGVDSGDLVVGPGHRQWIHHPVPLFGDNEFGLIGCQSVMQRPKTLGDA
jgi:hypothetical protein